MTADSSVNVPLEADQLSAQIAAALLKHPVLYYSAQLENSHILPHSDKKSFLATLLSKLLMPIMQLCLILFAR